MPQEQQMKRRTLLAVARLALVTVAAATLPARSQSADWGDAGVIAENQTAASDTIRKVAIDDAYVYAAGTTNSGVMDFSKTFGTLHLEKFNKATGAPCARAGQCAGGEFGTAGAVSEKPPGAHNQYNGLFVDAAAIYLSGTDATAGFQGWRIERRNKDTGALCGRTGRCPGSAFGTGGAVSVTYGGGPSYAWEIVADADYIYIAGAENVSGKTDYKWHVEKRHKITGALCDGFAHCADGNFANGGIFRHDASSGDDEAVSLAVDGSYLYVAGYAMPNGDRESVIAKLDRITGKLCQSLANCAEGEFGTGGFAVHNVSVGFFDEPFQLKLANGYLYLAGQARFSHPTGADYAAWLEKRSAVTGAPCDGPASCGDGAFAAGGIAIAADSSGHDAFYGLDAGGGAVYAVGISENLSLADQSWLIHKYDGLTGLPCSTAAPCGGAAFGDGGAGLLFENPSPSHDFATAVAVDALFMYVGGFDSLPGKDDTRWRIERRLLSTGALMP
jgi:hypothetical protein